MPDSIRRSGRVRERVAVRSRRRSFAGVPLSAGRAGSTGLPGVPRPAPVGIGWGFWRQSALAWSAKLWLSVGLRA